MSENWIKMRNNLQSHPKVVRMSSALKADRLRIIGGLHAVWCLFDEHSTDGTLSGYDADSIDSLIGFEGFSRALSAVKWLEIHADFVALPEFDEHNGQSAKRRAMETKRKRAERLQDVRTVSASHADKKRTREEEIREEKKEERDIALRAAKQCPKDFCLTDELAAWAASKAPSADPVAELDSFKDYTFPRAIKDWDGAFRNWMRKAHKDAQKAASGRQMSFAEENRQRVLAAVPSLAAKPMKQATEFFMEVEAKDVTPAKLGR